MATPRRPGLMSVFIAGIVCGIAGMLALAWLAAR
jgi:hypothetical protein